MGRDNARPSSEIQTMNCKCCNVKLAFPAGSRLIQCPECKTNMTPDPPVTKRTVCIGCSAVLSHPVNARYIQCPRCAVTFECSGDPVLRATSAVLPGPLPSSKSQSMIPPFVPPTSYPAKAARPQNSIYCLKCSSLLQYPDSAQFIECPVCESTQQTVWIQCPKCSACFNSRDKNGEVSRSNGALPPLQPGGSVQAAVSSEEDVRGTTAGKQAREHDASAGAEITNGDRPE
ncbi:unnamed protein product (mitochondrion) [Plasmodiophora brassicae]|uniref:Zinc finger LSD1-type domain-containing protein n=1 Tax=Plasmodiophora brassicae TaxID=37360 RepID=A0A3P3Y1N4_PLABS|nr:unnamed protein product [Plasmodiophora brassicae]